MYWILFQRISRFLAFQLGRCKLIAFRMDKTNRFENMENGKVLYYFSFDWIFERIFSSWLCLFEMKVNEKRAYFWKGPRMSDIKPKIRDNLRIKRKGLLMDEALTKTSNSLLLEFFNQFTAVFINIFCRHCVWAVFLEFGFFNYVLIFVSAMVLNAVVMETCGIGKVWAPNLCWKCFFLSISWAFEFNLCY